MSVVFLFLLAVAAGALTTLFSIPEDDLGRGYFQMNALVVLGLLAIALAAAWLGPHDLYPAVPIAGAGATTTTPAPVVVALRRAGPSALLASFAAAFAYYAAVWRERWRAARAAAGLAVAASMVALVAAGSALVGRPTPLPARDALLACGLVASALLLGWSLVTMLLGHWYLVAPRLAFRHLVVFCWVLLGTVLLRLAVVAMTLSAARRVDPLVEPHPYRLLTSLSGEGVFFWVRLLWGLAIPLALAVMSLHCARQRSNQSATGILYVLVVGTFIGEITALYLTVATGVPV